MRQFYLLGTTFFCVACGGMGIFSVAKPMMGEVFSSTLPSLVTAAFASQYVQMLAAGNLGGRIGWAGQQRYMFWTLLSCIADVACSAVPLRSFL